jgi:ferredoxin
MGHISAKKAYLGLQQRLDRMPIGAPAHSALFEILEALFTEEECRVASSMPLRLTKLKDVAKNAGLSQKRTRQVLETLAWKGLVADLPRDGNQTLYFLNPTVIGFFEYTMMRVREDIDQKKVAELMWAYLREDPDLGFMRMLTQGETFIARPLVNENALEPEVYSEVLDWEKASYLIEEAGSWAKGICHCRHVKFHKGEPCDYPIDHCLSLGNGAEYLIRHELARRIDRSQALEILAYARENRTVQMADNIRHKPGFICNCCKCCCEILEGLRTLPGVSKVVTSNYVAASDARQCIGCGKCAEACPINVIEMIPSGPTDEAPNRKKRAVIDEALCLGCGVCHTACRFGAINLRPVGQRVLAPENMLEKLILQAIERGKLQHLLFSDHTRLTHRTLAAFFKALLNLPPGKQLLANRQLKSRFVQAMLSRLKPKRQKKKVEAYT